MSLFHITHVVYLAVMTHKTKLRYLVVFVLLGIFAPIWLPLMEGYLFQTYGNLVTKPTRNIVENTNGATVIFAFIYGNCSVAYLCNSWFGRIFAVLAYSFISVIVLFITGWSALGLAGYGH